MSPTAVSAIDGLPMTCTLPASEIDESVLQTAADCRPAEVLFDERPAVGAQPCPQVRVSCEASDLQDELLRCIRDEDVAFRLDVDSLQSHRCRDDRYAHRQRVENLQPRAATIP